MYRPIHLHPTAETRHNTQQGILHDHPDNWHAKILTHGAALVFLDGDGSPVGETEGERETTRAQYDNSQLRLQQVNVKACVTSVRSKNYLSAAPAWRLRALVLQIRYAIFNFITNQQNLDVIKLHASAR